MKLGEWGIGGGGVRVNKVLNTGGQPIMGGGLLKNRGFGPSANYLLEHN